MGRIKELAEIFPEFRDKLLAIRETGSDLLYIVKWNKGQRKLLLFAKIFSPFQCKITQMIEKVCQFPSFLYSNHAEME